MPAHARIPKEVQERLKDGHVGPYKILSVVGAGGMGAVFRCKDAKLHRDVAVKLLLAPDDGRNIQRFLAEARTLARLSHPNVVQVYDVGYDGHVPYFVMEHIIGESLAQRLERLGRLGVDHARDVIIQAARGLAAVHGLGIIHRDVKAANVIVSHGGVVKLLDFGISRPLENAPALTSSGLVMGTPSSMAPEQLRGEELDPRADVYALGVLLYQLLTGQRPYENEEDPEKLARRQAKEPPRRVSEMRSDVPSDLQRMLDRALARRREDRYWNCEELLNDLAGPFGATASNPSAGWARLSSGSERAIVRSASRRQWTLLVVGGVLAAFAAVSGARVALEGCLLCESPVAGAEGRPDLDASPSGVFVWHDGTGWHIRAKSVDAAVELSGLVRVTGGILSEVSALDDASADGLILQGRRVATFRFDDPGPGAGFDFRADAGCVEISVSSGNEPAPARLRVGRDGTSPPSLPVRFCR